MDQVKSAFKKFEGVWSAEADHTLTLSLILCPVGHVLSERLNTNL